MVQKKINAILHSLRNNDIYSIFLFRKKAVHRILVDYGIEMSFVKGGTFTMGCTYEQSSDCNSDEKPAHQVTLSDFYIGKYELTLKQFEKFIAATGYKTDADKEGWSYVYNGSSWEKKNGVNWKCDASGNTRQQSEFDHAVIHVSWNDAKAYCEWLSQKSGKTYRLPTEAEWEYAARGGNLSNGYKYSGSNNIGEVAWYCENSGSKTHPVGQKKANELGIYDMSGNVGEWCEDWYGNYSSCSQINPTGASSGYYRVFRGGSRSSYAIHCRIAYRSSFTPANRIYFIGFRLVCLSLKDKCISAV
jgi:formylglycine-generating enzyme required for sulfatase activity